MSAAIVGIKKQSSPTPLVGLDAITAEDYKMASIRFRRRRKIKQAMIFAGTIALIVFIWVIH
jgi:hypothetical protein